MLRARVPQRLTAATASHHGPRPLPRTYTVFRVIQMGSSKFNTAMGFGDCFVSRPMLAPGGHALGARACGVPRGDRRDCLDRGECHDGDLGADGRGTAGTSRWMWFGRT